jgi:hypothetical protein
MITEIAKTTMFEKTARETALLLQPNSAITGFIMTPMVNLAPELMKRMRDVAARTYQP